MDKVYVCKKCGFAVREIDLEDWSKHDFVGKDFFPPDKVPDYDKEIDCENYENLWDAGRS